MASVSACPNISALEEASRDTPEKRSFGIFIYVFGQVFLTFCLFVFLWGKYVRRYERIKKRHAILLYSVYLGAMLQHQADPLEMMIGPDNYLCIAKLIISMLIVPFIGAGIVGKLVAFFFRTRFEQQAIDTAERKLDTEEYEKRTDQMMRTMARGARELFLFNEEKSLELGSLRFLQSGMATVLLLICGFLIPSIIVGIIVAFVDPVMASGCSGCLQSFPVAVFLIVQCVVAGSLTFAALLRVRHLADNFGIITETLISLLLSSVGVIGYGLSYFLPNVYRVWNFTFLMSLAIWSIMATQTLVQVLIAMKKEGPEIARRASKRVDVDINSSQRDLRSYAAGDLTKLPNVLANPEVLRRFEEHLANEFGIESLLFYKDAKRWKAEFNDVSQSTRKARAKHIVNIYIRQNGVFAINVPSSISKALINSVELQQELTADFFNEATYEIQHLLEKGALNRFAMKENSRAMSFVLQSYGAKDPM